MYAEVALVLVSSGTKVHPQIILDIDYLRDYLFISYDYGSFYLCTKKSSEELSRIKSSTLIFLKIFKSDLKLNID